MAYTESFKKSGETYVSTTDVISMYRDIYTNRLNKGWPVPGNGVISASSEEGKLFGSRNRAGTWGTPADIKQSEEMKVKAFQYLYQLSHYGESTYVKQHAPYAKTFPAFNAGNELASGSEIFSSYYNELERYKNDISSSRGNIGCSSGCSGTCASSCLDTCVSGCDDDNCENSCKNGGSDSCSSSDCGSQCTAYCVSKNSDGCASGCTADCENSCVTTCLGGCNTSSSECISCTANCQTACLGSSDSYAEYNDTCDNCGKKASTDAGCASNCGKVANKS